LAVEAAMRWAWLVAMAVCALGCGDDEEHVLEGTQFVCAEVDLLDFDACGGDIEGTWHVTDSCTQAVVVDPFPECPDARASIEVAPVGSLSFGADGQSGAHLTLRTRARVLIPHSCLEGLAGAGRGCADLRPPEGIDSCVDHDDGCLCVGSEVENLNDTGTWSVQDSTVTTVSSDGRQTNLNYCVDGRFLDVQVQTLAGIGQVPVISRLRLLAPQ
jgi:hypothetical protein